MEEGSELLGYIATPFTFIYNNNNRIESFGAIHFLNIIKRFFLSNVFIPFIFILLI